MFCLVVAGSLTSHTVRSRSGRSSTWVMPIARASMSVLPGARARRAAPATQLCCGLLFCALYDVSCSVGLLHKTYAAAPTQPISFATAAQEAAAWQALLVSSSFFPQFLCELPTRPPDPRALFSLFCLGSRLPTQEI